jgi:uncharacterized protein (TIGR00251 family)
MIIQMKTWYQKINDIITLTIYVQPGAKRNEVVGAYGNSLKIKLAAPPIDGRANKALINYIATLFNVPLSHVTLKRGTKSRYKIIDIQASQIEPKMLWHTLDDKND